MTRFGAKPGPHPRSLGAGRALSQKVRTWHSLNSTIVLNRFVLQPAIYVLALAALLSACTSAPPLPASQAPLAHEVPSTGLPTFARVLRRAQPASLVPAIGMPHAVPSGKFIYTAQLYGNDAKVYRQKKTTITFLETLTQGLSAPQGTVATIDGWWYVANAGNSNVLIYRTTHKGPQGPVDSLDDHGQFPGNVDVSPNRRLVAISNISTAGGGPGSVSVYLNRRAVYSRVLTYGNHRLQGIGIAVDVHGDCYWSFNDPSTGTGSIVEFVRCDGSGSIVVPTIAYAGGITFDQHGNLYYIDQSSGVYKCSGTSNCKLFATGFGAPLNLNFDHRQKHLWVTDLTGYIDAVDPANGQIESSTPTQGGSSDPPFGIAPAPGA